MKPEAKIKQSLKKMLKEEFPQVWTYWPVSNGMGTHGVPDLIMRAGGKFIGIEVKAEDKKVTLLQANQLQKINDSGGAAMALAGKDAVDKLRTLLLCMHLPRAPDVQHHYPISSVTQNEYDAIPTKDPNTIYRITDAAP